jgi:hypothetical protein
MGTKQIAISNWQSAKAKDFYDKKFLGAPVCPWMMAPKPKPEGQSMCRPVRGSVLH